MKKKAELTTQQIVVLVILITSFAVILFFLFRLDLGKETEKEICRNSVIMRGDSILSADTYSLNCHTSYICITEDGSCEKMTDPEIKKAENKEEVYRILADEMVDCWWMFGEGKVNYVGKDMTEKLYCSICSQIAFDDTIQAKIGKEISEEDFYEYLSDNKISGEDITYSEYLYGSKDVFKNSQENFTNITLDNQQYIVMGIASDIDIVKWIAVGAIGGLVLAPILGAGTIVGAIIVTAGGVGGNFVGAVVEGLSGNDYLRPTIVEVNSDEFKALNCESVTTLA